MSRVAVVLAALTAGCFTKPPFQSGGDDDDNGDGGTGADDARRDTGTTGEPDAPQGTCAGPHTDTFTMASPSGDPCAPWGSAGAGGVTISRDLALGVLRMTPPSMSYGTGNCTSSAFDFANGASVRLQLALTHYGSSSAFSITETTSFATTTITVSTTGGSQPTQIMLTSSVVAGAIASATYDATAMKWLRFVPASTTTMRAAYSADGESWTQLGDVVHPMPIGTVTVRLGVSAMYGDGQLHAEWDDLNVVTCPP